jgi:hypothetical protein
MKTWWKWLGGLLAGAALLAAGGAWWLHDNLDAIVKRGIAHYGSQMTQARVAVEAVQIHGTDGSGVVRGLVVGNPAGFRTDHALRVAAIEVAVDMRTLADPVVVVRRIVVDAPDVIYEQGDTITNFDAIQQNIARTLGTPSGGSAAAKDAPPRRLIVDELVIRRARAQASAAGLAGRTVSATLPDITLRGVGRAQGGVTPAQLGQIVARALSQRLVASLSFGAVRSLGDRVKGWFQR